MIGAKLAHYEITSHIGSGGMGDVYQATDTKLGRSVAIKFLPAPFSQDSERIAGFRREARVLASLNHSNIAAIHGLEEIDSRHFLVMELVPGETLAERIKRGAIPIEEALRIAKQIAEALEEAHEKGIIHRDLKPANIKLTPDGKAKVLDFGLAKAFAGNESQADLSNSPTLNIAATQAGVILGTAAYMSPEQARGKTVDKRTDIWSFGVVLYEMVTGKPLFEGEDLSETLSKVIQAEPKLDEAPFRTRRLLAHCLEKDPKKRLRDIGDYELLLGQKTAESSEARMSRSFALMGWAAAAAIFVLAAVAIGNGWLRTRLPEPESHRVALTIVSPVDSPLEPVGSLASIPEISPDGTAVLFGATGGLYVRTLDSLKPALVPDSSRYTGAAFWSADSTSVLFPSDGGLIKVRMPDGAPEMVTRLPGFSRSGSSNNNGVILVSLTGRLYLLTGTGANPEVVEVPGLKSGRIKYPEFLPDGENFLFFWKPYDAGGEIYMASLKAGKVVDQVLLLKNDTAARYTPAGGGRILFVRNNNLYSQKLDLNRRKLVGDSQFIQEGVASGPGLDADLADFSVSRSGVVAWRPGVAALSQVTAFDRKGMVFATMGPPMPIQSLRLAPNELRLLAVGDPRERTWLLDVGQPGRFDLGPDAGWSFWSADGTRLIGMKDEKLVERAVSGNGEAREIGEYTGIPQDLSPDGSYLLFRRNGVGVQRLNGSPEERAFKLLVAAKSGEGTGGETFSPDGRWIVYRQGGGIFVQPFPGPGLRQQIAAVRGEPRWRGDGKEIIFRREAEVYSVRVDTLGDGKLRFGMPELLFSGLRMPAGSNASARPLAVSRDGSRLYWPQAAEQPGSDVIQVRTNAVN